MASALAVSKYLRQSLCPCVPVKPRVMAVRRRSSFRPATCRIGKMPGASAVPDIASLTDDEILSLVKAAW